MQCLYSPNYFDHYSADMIPTEDRMEIALFDCTNHDQLQSACLSDDLLYTFTFLQLENTPLQFSSEIKTLFTCLF